MPSGLRRWLVRRQVRVVAATADTFYGVPMTAGDIYTVDGNGQPGFAGDGGPATKAELDGPGGVGVTGSGALVVADVNDGRAREISRSASPRTGTRDISCFRGLH